MTIKEDFEEAAVEIFLTFESVLIDAVYVQKSSTYTAGGNAAQTPVEYPMRLLRDEKVTRATLSITNDLPAFTDKYLFVTKSVPVVVQEKDQIKVDGVIKAVLLKDSDPADAVTVIYVG